MGNANGETKYAAYESDLTIEFPKIHNFLKDKIEKKDIFLINKCKNDLDHYSCSTIPKFILKRAHHKPYAFQHHPRDIPPNVL